MRPPRVLAEKIETAEDLAQARDLNVDFVQGFLWGLPQLITGLRITPSASASLALVQHLHQGTGSTATIVEEIKRCPAVVQGLLRYVNSGLFRWVSRIDTIEHAVTMLGHQELLRWAALMAAQEATGSGIPADIALTAITRGRFCELTASELETGGDALDYFLIGLFSLADSMFGVPLSEALTYVPLSPSLLAAIAEDAGEAGLVLRAARAVERGDVGAIIEAARTLGLTPSELQTIYLDAAQWGTDCV